MRRLSLLLSTIVAVDITFFTALAPLLPHFASRYDLSKTAAGVLFAAFGAVSQKAFRTGLNVRRFRVTPGA